MTVSQTYSHTPSHPESGALVLARSSRGENAPDPSDIRYRISEASCIIGSGTGATLVLEDAQGVSPAHAEVVRIPGGAYIRSLAEALVINGQPVQEAWIQQGDQLQIGQVKLVVETTCEEAWTALESLIYEESTASPAIAPSTAKVAKTADPVSLLGEGTQSAAPGGAKIATPKASSATVAQETFLPLGIDQGPVTASAARQVEKSLHARRGERAAQDPAFNPFSATSAVQGAAHSEPFVTPEFPSDPVASGNPVPEPEAFRIEPFTISPPASSEIPPTSTRNEEELPPPVSEPSPIGETSWLSDLYDSILPDEFEDAGYSDALQAPEAIRPLATMTGEAPWPAPDSTPEPMGSIAAVGPSEFVSAEDEAIGNVAPAPSTTPEKLPARNESAGTSVADILERMREAGELDYGIENSLAAKQPVPHPKPLTTATPAPAATDDVNDYMTKLLKRVGGSPEASAPVSYTGPAVPEKPASRFAKSMDIASPAELEPVDVMREEDFVPRSEAPEKHLDLAELRQFAMQSVKAAIQKSTQKKNRVTRLMLMGASALSLAVGVMLLLISNSWLDSAFLTGSLSILGAAFFGYLGLSSNTIEEFSLESLRKVFQKKPKQEPEPEPKPDPETPAP